MPLKLHKSCVRGCESRWEGNPGFSTTTPPWQYGGEHAHAPGKAGRIHGRIPDSCLVVIPGAGHTSTVEEPEAVNLALNTFLGELA